MYLTTVGGKVQGGLPPGYRPASSEDLGLPSTTPTTPTEVAQKPVIPPHLGGIDADDAFSAPDFAPPDFRDVTEVMGYAPIGWSLAEIAKVGIASLLPGGTFLAGTMISKKQDEQKEQIEEQMQLQHKTTEDLPADFFMTSKEKAKGKVTGDTLSVRGKDFSIGYGKGKVDPSLAAAVAGNRKGKPAVTPVGDKPAVTPAGDTPASVGYSREGAKGKDAYADPDNFGGGSVGGGGSPAGFGDDPGSGFGLWKKGGLVSKKMRQKKGSKGLASV